jgi:hypothetical protein
MSALVEAMARAYCKADGLDPDAMVWPGGPSIHFKDESEMVPQWTEHVDSMASVLRAMAEVEPSDGELRAGYDVAKLDEEDEYGNLSRKGCAEIRRAMLRQGERDVRMNSEHRFYLKVFMVDTIAGIGGFMAGRHIGANVMQCMIAAFISMSCANLIGTIVDMILIGRQSRGRET